MVTSQRTPRNTILPNPFAGLLAGPRSGPAVYVVEGGRDRLLTVREVAARLCVSTATVYKLVNGGELAHTRVANSIRLAPADLEAYLADRRVGP